MPWRDMRTMKFQPMAAEAFDFSLEFSKSAMVAVIATSLTRASEERRATEERRLLVLGSL